VRSLIKSLAKQKTIVFSTHILSEVEALADRIVIVNEGKLVANGTKAELAQSIQSPASSLEEIFIN